MKCDMKTKKVKGYEVKTFIEEGNYELLKNKAKDMNLTIDEYVEKLIREDCKKCKNMKK